jgi:hypothetical protein
MGKKRNACRVLVRKPEGKSPLDEAKKFMGLKRDKMG